MCGAAAAGVWCGARVSRPIAPVRRLDVIVSLGPRADVANAADRMERDRDE